MSINALVFSNVKRDRKKSEWNNFLSVNGHSQEAFWGFRGGVAVLFHSTIALALQASCSEVGPGAGWGPVVWRFIGWRWKLCAVQRCVSMKCSKKRWAGRPSEAWSTVAVGTKRFFSWGRAVIPSNVKKQTKTQGRGREEGSKSITRRDCQALREGAGYHTWARAHPTVLKRIWPW